MITLPASAFDGVEFTGGAFAVMRDGTRLCADIYRPLATAENPGPWPVLLMRQPYGRDIASTVVYAHPTWYVRKGFIVVIQDVRGRGDSEGEFYTFRNEIDDGHDTVQWAAALTGSNGRVGMYGFSYQGSTQLLAALGKPASLKALAPHMTAFDLYSGWFYRDGMLQLSTTIGWANQMLREDARRKNAPSEAALEENWRNGGALSSRLPVREIPPLTNTDLPGYGRDWLTHAQPGEYWDEFDLLQKIDALGLPMFHLSGWYDLYLRGSVDGFRAMAQRHPNQFLLASPWCHIPWGNRVGALNLGPAAEPVVDEMMAAWFHHWLDQDTPTTPAPLAGCRYFSLGENAWKQATTWPPAEALTQSWFLTSAGKANSSFGDGLLSSEAASGPDDLFNYDPEVPVAAPGGNQGGYATFGPHDLAAQQQGNNLLVYDTAPFTSQLHVAGDATVVLHVQSSAEQTAFVARLSVVAPDGRATFLTLGAAQANAREGDGTEITIKLDPLAVRIAPGERLRLDIASSAFPLLIRHPNTTQDPASVTKPGEYLRALQIVRHNAKHPSRIELPVLPV